MGADLFDHPADFIGTVHVETHGDAATLELAVHQFVYILAVINQQ